MKWNTDKSSFNLPIKVAAGHKKPDLKVAAVITNGKTCIFTLKANVLEIVKAAEKLHNYKGKILDFSGIDRVLDIMKKNDLEYRTLLPLAEGFAYKAKFDGGAAGFGDGYQIEVPETKRTHRYARVAFDNLKISDLEQYGTLKQHVFLEMIDPSKVSYEVGKRKEYAFEWSGIHRESHTRMIAGAKKWLAVATRGKITGDAGSQFFTLMDHTLIYPASPRDPLPDFNVLFGIGAKQLGRLLGEIPKAGRFITKLYEDLQEYYGAGL